MNKMNYKIILVTGFIFVISFISLNAQSIHAVNSKEVQVLLKRDSKMIVLDVRTPEEFSQGHVPGAINMNLNSPGMLDNLNKLDKNAKYIIYCRTKNRSGVVANHMYQNGFKSVYQMTDGMVGWNQYKLQAVK